MRDDKSLWYSRDKAESKVTNAIKIQYREELICVMVGDDKKLYRQELPLTFWFTSLHHPTNPFLTLPYLPLNSSYNSLIFLLLVVGHYLRIFL